MQKVFQQDGWRHGGRRVRHQVSECLSKVQVDIKMSESFLLKVKCWGTFIFRETSKSKWRKLFTPAFENSSHTWSNSLVKLKSHIETFILTLQPGTF